MEIYDLSPASASSLANMSTRGIVGIGADALISGFIVGAVDSSTVVVRLIGRSLGTAGISDPLSDPSFTVYDENGLALAANDNWRGSAAPSISNKTKSRRWTTRRRPRSCICRLAPILPSQPAPTAEPESA